MVKCVVKKVQGRRRQMWIDDVKSLTNSDIDKKDERVPQCCSSLQRNSLIIFDFVTSCLLAGPRTGCP